MAEPCAIAFGRYLRTLRERKGLSLDQVTALSHTFPETLHKGYLSRCENGRQKLAFAKLIPLSRIYEVPADVLVERMELDMELDRIGGPETEGLDFGQLTDLGKEAMEQGVRWKAYGYLRDAVGRAAVDPVKPSFRDTAEQVAISFMSCGTAARALGRHRFALHEYLHLYSVRPFGPKFHAVILERISACYLACKDFTLAEKFVKEAIRHGESIPDKEFLGYAYDKRGHLAFDQTGPESAIGLFQKAHDAFKAARFDAACAKTLINLAQCYFETGNYGAARRSLEASARLATSVSDSRAYALSQILLGEIDELQDRAPQAVQRWRDATDIAKRLRDRELRFKAEFLLLRRARAEGNLPAARAIRRRLHKLTPWLTRHIGELDSLKQLDVGVTAD